MSRLQYAFLIAVILVWMAADAGWIVFAGIVAGLVAMGVVKVLQGEIDLGDIGLDDRLIAQPAQDRGMQGSNPKRSTETRQQSVPVLAHRRKRNGVFRQRRFRVDREQRKVGRATADLPRKGLELRIVGFGCDGKNDGGLQFNIPPL